MKLAFWLSLLGIIVAIAGVAAMSSYILLIGAALILVSWAIYGVATVASILAAYFR